MRWRFGSCARRVVVVDRAVVVGHGQATSRLIRSRFAALGTSRRFRACLVCIKWKRERDFCSAISSSRSARPFLTAAPLPLSRRRERLFTSFFRLFIVYRRRLSFSSSSRASLRAAKVSRKGGRRERGRRRELTDPFAIRGRNVGLVVVHREEFGAGVFH